MHEKPRREIYGCIVTVRSGKQGDDVIPQLPTQLSLALDPQMSERHRSLKSCLAACVYQHGLERVAAKLDLSPSHLSEALGGGGERGRKVDLDWLERYVETYGDTTPVLYLVAKFLHDPKANDDARQGRIENLLSELATLVGDKPLRRRRV